MGGVSLASRSLPRFLFTGKALRVLLHLPDFARLYWRLFRDSRVSLLPKALLVLSLAYLVWPFDVIPDFIPVVGEMDDLSVVAGGLWAFVRLCPPPVVREHVSAIADGKRAHG
jgi:uncharacterized membrane protein YkvA (DUF1232 family)